MQRIIKEAVLKRALSPNASYPRSFLRWAGSKRFLLDHIVELLPDKFNVYREPFLGSGALYFLLQPKKAVLSDTCADLVETFSAVRDNVSAVLRYLSLLDPSEKTYYEIRRNRSQGQFKYAAEFIYLNKTCWNGLYRVNSAGLFNVPYGRNESGVVVDPKNLKACAESLGSKSIVLKTCNFEENLKEAKQGDLVYLDPPYVTGHNNNGFVAYNEVLFSWDDQERLAKLALALAQKGVHVIVSNADHEAIVDLYKDFSVKRFYRSSTLASDITKRRKISEVLLYLVNF